VRHLDFARRIASTSHLYTRQAASSAATDNDVPEADSTTEVVEHSITSLRDSVVLLMSVQVEASKSSHYSYRHI
jgi:hypothetical protein